MKTILILLFSNIFLFAVSLDHIKQKLQHTFLTAYETLQIQQIEITPLTKLPKDLSSYTLEQISLSNAALKRNSGNFSAVLSKSSRKKRIYLKYNLKASIHVWKAKNDIPRGKFLQTGLLKKASVPFNTFYKQPIDASYIEKYRSKRLLKEGSVVYASDVDKILAVKRNDLLIATLKDAALAIEFSVQAVQGGDIGDVIKVRNNHKKILRAKITSKKRVEIVE